ncbi:MAG: hypothetical protein WC832_04415 [Anaerolineales bacterium]
MVTPAIHTIVKMLERLPEAAQKDVAEHLRAYLAEAQDEQKWEQAFAKTQYKLANAAHQAHNQIAEGKSEPMDFDQL